MVVVLVDERDLGKGKGAFVVVIYSSAVLIAICVNLDPERVQQLIEVVGEESKNAADESGSRHSDDTTDQ